MPPDATRRSGRATSRATGGGCGASAPPTMPSSSDGPHHRSRHLGRSLCKKGNLARTYRLKVPLKGRDAAKQAHVGVNLIRRGAGEPLVLLHGIGHRWQAWLPVMDDLTAHHEVIALDLPGFGASPVPQSGMPSTMAQSVADLATFLAGEGFDRPH